MGAIKDLFDLVSKLANNVSDRKVASELNAIQSTIAAVQSEHATLHETNVELRETVLKLKERIQQLEAEKAKLVATPVAGPSDTPTCPNCSTATKPYFMSPVPPNFVRIMNATHECNSCNYNTRIDA